MDSDDDYQSFSHPAEPSPPASHRRLKRLKKHSSPKPSIDPPFDDPLLFPQFDFAKLVALENGLGSPELNDSESPEETALSRDSKTRGVGSEKEMGYGFDKEVRKTKRVLEFDADDDMMGVIDGTEGGREGFDSEANVKERAADGDPFEEKEEKKKKEKNEKKRVKSGGETEEGKEGFDSEANEKEMVGERDRFEEKDEKEKKNEKKRVKSGDELKTKLGGSNKRREEKERKAYLKELHAESQRLLRETREASFKPIPVVRKPISSVLEKIRKRKLEISKKVTVVNDRSWDYGENSRSGDRPMDLELSSEQMREDNEELIVERGKDDPFLDEHSSLDASNGDECKDAAKQTIHENDQNQVTPNEESTPAFRAPVDDTQDLFDDSEPNADTSVQEDEQINIPLEEDLAPSLPYMNLTLDSAPLDDSSSDEEDNEKENLDPGPRGNAHGAVSPKGDPVKDFVDDEAEEEDDSDNDLNRFQDDEAEDLDDFEELKDMIATGYKERPIDNEKRNELHQKWLEQQDAAGTDNLMQKLKCGSVLRDAILQDKEPESDEDDENFDDEAKEESLPHNSARVNIKKAKEMILQLFSDKEEAYLSDGDDDIQRKRANCLLIRKEEQGTLVSPADDENSKEVFGLIKKLNISSDNKKKPKAVSYFDSVLKGGNSNSSSKSSFLGRVSNHPIPSSHKQGSGTVRSFIFGREDNNSRSSISMSEDSSETASQETRPTKTFTAKYSNSQTKFRGQNRDAVIETRTSLLEVLKRSSSQSHVGNQESTVDLTKGIFSFRAPKKLIKIDGRS